MLLAEAIREKDYIENSIYNLGKHIGNLLSVKDKTEFRSNKTLIDSRLDELEDLYKRYQQFSVRIQMAKAKAIIKVNDSELNMLDAEALCEVFRSKIGIFTSIINNASMHAMSDGIFDSMEETRLDLKTIESEIQFATWKVGI